MNEKERIRTAAMATASAMKANMNKGVAHQKSNRRASMEEVQRILDGWGSFPRKAAKDTIEKYGLPQEAIPSQLIWYNNGPWKRTRVIRDEIPHHFPQPHTDVVENVINYEVPAEMLGDLAKFDGSIYVDRTRGEVASRCDMEAANIISLNIMHDLVSHKLSVEKARKKHGEITLAYLTEKSVPYAEQLQFDISVDNQGYKDRSQMGKVVLHNAGRKLKDGLWKGNRKFALVPLAGFLLMLGLLNSRSIARES